MWLNGQMVDPSKPQLHVDDHGVIVGDGVFETLLVIPGSNTRTTTTTNNNNTVSVAFAMQRHLNRLRRSAAALRLDCPWSDENLRDAVAQCLLRAPDSGIVRITVTSGGGIVGSQRGGGTGSVIVIAGNKPTVYAKGTAVAVVPFARNERGAMTGIKTTSYAENVLALDMARRSGATEAIFADTQGRVSEGTGSNIFWTDGERLHTPPLDTGCLAGVTRELIMEQMAVTETHLLAQDLSRVPEAFLASSTRLVQSIGRINDTELPVIDGPLTAAAAAAMTELVSTNIDP